MKYAVLKVTDGNYNVHQEGFTNVNSAKISFHQLCAALWNEPSVIKAEVKIVDENLDCVEDYKEFISHPQPEPTPEEPQE